NLGHSGDDDHAANPLDRFLAQVEQLSLSTCLDVCPACLATQCAQGPIEITRHALSRRLLRLAHRLLTAAFTRTPDTPVAEFLVPAKAHGWLVLEHATHLTPDLALALRHAGLEQLGQFVEYPAGQPPRLRSLWRLSSFGVRPL